jgi:nucleotide-binding universal stress UspA family protein
LTDAGRRAFEATVEGLREESIEADLVVCEEPCVVAIARQVAKTNADLVIVGKRALDVQDGHRLGSVARALIHDCPGAIWVVRPGHDSEHGRILAAADLTPVGERVVRTASQVAPALEAELHLVHALSLPLAVQVESTTEQERYLEDRGAEARKQLSAWLKDAPATTHVGLTSPTQAVLSGVEQLSPSLVVMGTVSRHGISGRIIGNTAERLLDRLDTSLLVVKPEEFESPLL